VQQSNTYIIVFISVVTIVLGGLLSAANQVLKPAQQRSMELDAKRQILTAVVSLEGKKGKEILDLYSQTIGAVVVDINGDVIETNEKGEPMTADQVNVAKNYKLAPEKRMYPVYTYHQPGKPDAVEAYIFPMYGNGLWGPVWGYLALSTDLNTIQGVVFDHESETPGLGARITTELVQTRYKGKKMFDPSGNLVSVSMLKGESNPESSLDEHHIDGLSGATITGKGVNAMLRNYLGYYSGYIRKISTRTGQDVALLR
jgi:Na+-transporting NADH:ubiquinone oxidoreductase subunit C